MILVKSRSVDKPLDLSKVMQYALTIVQLSLGTPNGFFNKTNKAAMLKYFWKVCLKMCSPQNAFYIQDGDALFHFLINLADTIKGICLQLLDTMIAKTNFVFFIDSDFPHSIKSQERLCQGWLQSIF